MNLSLVIGAAPRRRSSRVRGSGLLGVVGLIAVVGGLTAILNIEAAQQYVRGGRFRDSVILKNLVEGGIARARAELRVSPAYAGTQRLTLACGEVRIAITGSGNARRIEVTAAVPTLGDARRTEKRSVDYPDGGH
jgi:hypothetical protein